MPRRYNDQQFDRGPQREEDDEEVNMALNVHRTIRLISDGIQEKVNFTILCVIQARSRGGR